MFFTFPRTLAGTPSSRPWVSGSRSGSTVFRRLLRRTTSNGPGSKASPRGSCADAADRGWER